MNRTTIEVENSEEEILCADFSDEALENAAAMTKDKAGSLTISFCSGYDSCPV